MIYCMVQVDLNFKTHACSIACYKHRIICYVLVCTCLIDDVRTYKFPEWNHNTHVWSIAHTRYEHRITCYVLACARLINDIILAHEES